MSSEALANGIRSRMEALGLSQTVIYDNDGQEPPKDGSTWVRFSIIDGETDQADIGAGTGSTRFRTPGIVKAAIHTRIGIGDKDARELADTISDQFRSVTVNGITFRTPSLQKIGNQGAYYRVDVNMPFYYDFLN